MAFHRLKGDKPMIIVDTGTWYWDRPMGYVFFIPKGKRTATEGVWLTAKQNSQLGALRAAVKFMENATKEA